MYKTIWCNGADETWFGKWKKRNPTFRSQMVNKCDSLQSIQETLNSFVWVHCSNENKAFNVHTDAAVQLVSFQIEFPRGRPTRSDSDELLTHAALALYQSRTESLCTPPPCAAWRWQQIKTYKRVTVLSEICLERDCTSIFVRTLTDSTVVRPTLTLTVITNCLTLILTPSLTLSLNPFSLNPQNAKLVRTGQWNGPHPVACTRTLRINCLSCIRLCGRWWWTHCFWHRSDLPGKEGDKWS